MIPKIKMILIIIIIIMNQKNNNKCPKNLPKVTIKEKHH